jgi:diguanylate cyclase (GGDEF)-like protein
MEKIIIEKNNIRSVTGTKWFETNSIKIDAYAQMINNKLEMINKSAKHEKEQYLFHIGILWLLLLIVSFISFILIYALRQSIVNPIEDVTMAMQDLTEGNKTFYFNTYKRDDLMGKMVIAFNNLRRYMIKSDYTEALLDIKDKKVDNYEKLSYVDPLTNLFNRRKYMESLKIEIEKSNKLGTELSLLTIDLDKFKHINDSFGHDVGDHVLKVFADSLKHIVKESGVVTRIGGEEFAVILPKVSKEKAMEFSEKILTSTREIDFSFIHKDVLLTVSIGMDIYKNSSTVDEFMKNVDKNLYEAKHTGRDRVCC